MATASNHFDPHIHTHHLIELGLKSDMDKESVILELERTVMSVTLRNGRANDRKVIVWSGGA
jgi:hypothetical protein